MGFIGVYDYTVILTYISLLSAVTGMILTGGGHYMGAVLCLAFSGICDAFDGRIARSKKNRTQREKSFGIQIDSLCDVVCFGIFPGLLCYGLGVRGILGSIIVAGYCVCAVIRLAYFNVLEGERQQQESTTVKAYHGLPVTSVSVALPVVFCLRDCLPAQVFTALLCITLAVCGFLFVLDFRLPKPKLKGILLMIAGVGVIIGGAFLLKG